MDFENFNEPESLEFPKLTFKLTIINHDSRAYEQNQKSDGFRCSTLLFWSTIVNFNVHLEHFQFHDCLQIAPNVVSLNR